MLKKMSSRLDRLVFLPVIAALAGIWGVAVTFTAADRGHTIDRIQGQLGLTVATVADANALAEAAAGTTADQRSANRNDVIWRALLQYPTASIWIESNGELVAGDAPLGDLRDYIVAEESRGGSIVHAALPLADALADWRRTAWITGGSLAVVSVAFLIITNFLASALRRRAIAERQTAEAMTRLLLRDRALEAITQGITITDDKAPGAPIVYTNPAFARLTKYTAEQISGRSPLSFFDAAQAGEISERLKKAQSDKRPWRAELEMKRNDGTSFLNSIATSLILGDDGEVIHSVMVHEDVTEVRQREELLVEAQKMESVGQLTGGIAHDFNNLLTAIRSNAEDLKEDLKSNPIHQRQADIVLQAANRGAGLVAQLMAFARKQELQPQTIDVNTLLDSFKKLLRSTLQANIAIEIRKENNLPSVFVDPARLESALLNLAINARDAMPGGGTLTIETMTKHLDANYVTENLEIEEGDYVLIAVTDSGSGMPPNVLERAFVPFFTTKEVGKGTGLGLSMVYGFVKQSGGNAKIYSEVGLGTVVRIYLPALARGAAAESGQERREALTPGKGSILLVEDDELVRQSISNRLTRLGYSVLTASDAHEAIETLQRIPDFDLVFSDVVMPGAMTGADLVREIRQRWPRMNVLLTSGYTESTVLGKIKMPVDVKLLSKPYSNADLATTVREVIAGSGAR